MAATFEGKVALITGGGSGIGRATSLIFARERAKVVVADVNAEGGEETVSSIKTSGGEAIFVHADVSKASSVEAMVGETVEAYGRLDCAFNNAGIVSPGSGLTHEQLEDSWDRVIEINLKGVWLCLKYEIPKMLEQGGGAIVNTSSALGLVSIGGTAAYSASKHAVVGLTKAVALEYAQRGIRINAVCPGWVETPMTAAGHANPTQKAFMLSRQPVGRSEQPEEVGEAVAWLCSEAASFVTGHAMPVDGGWTAQ